MGAATFAASAILHIWVMAVKYEGFNVSPGANVVAPGNYLIGYLKWTLWPFAGFYLFGFLRSYGTGFLARGLQRAPADFVAVLKETRSHLMERLVQERFLLAVGLASLAGGFLDRSLGRPWLLLAAVAALGAAFHDVRSAGPKQAALPAHRRRWLLGFGAALGLLMAYAGYRFWGIAALAAGAFLWWKRTQPPASSPGGKAVCWLVTAVGWGLAWRYLGEELGWADDGGADEFRADNPNGTVVDYLKTKEGQQVVGYGIRAGGAAAGGAVAGDVAGTATGTALGGGEGTPEMKTPKDYGPGKDNPWDPPIEKQREMWEKEGLVWDPDTLSWRKPRPNEIPPPKGMPEKPTPYERQKPRSEVPGACVVFYDRYVAAQAKVLDLRRQVDAARDKHLKAQDHLNKQLAKFTIKLGLDVGQIAGGGLQGIKDAGRVLKGPHGLGQKDTWTGPGKPPGAVTQALSAARAKLELALAKIKELGAKIAGLTRAAEIKNQAVEKFRSLAGQAREKVASARALLETAEGRARQAAEKLGVVRKLQALESEMENLMAKGRPLRDKVNQIRERDHLSAKRTKLYEEWVMNKPGAVRGGPLGDEMNELDILETDIGLLQKGPAPLTADQAADLAKKQARADHLAKRINEASAKYPELDDFIRQKDPSGAAAWEANPYRNVDAHTRGRELESLETALKDGKTRCDQIEAEMGSLKPSAPRGQTLDSMEAEARAADKELAKHRQELKEVQGSAEEAEAQAERAVKEAAEAEAERKAKNQELQALKEESEKAQNEIRELEAQTREGPGEHGTDPTQDPGGIAQALKNAAAQAGKKYERAFGKEQSPEEVAAILMQCKRSVADSAALLNRLLAEYDGQLSSLSGLKQKLDDCVARESGG